MVEEYSWCPFLEYHTRGHGWNGQRHQLYLPVKTHEGREVVASVNPGVPLLEWGVPSFLAIE